MPTFIIVSGHIQQFAGRMPVRRYDERNALATMASGVQINMVCLIPLKTVNLAR